MPRKRITNCHFWQQYLKQGSKEEKQGGEEHHKARSGAGNDRKEQCKGHKVGHYSRAEGEYARKE